MKRSQLCYLALASLFAVIATFAAAETVTIYRDNFGIPHIFAETEELQFN